MGGVGVRSRNMERHMRLDLTERITGTLTAPQEDLHLKYNVLAARRVKKIKGRSEFLHEVARKCSTQLPYETLRIQSSHWRTTIKTRVTFASNFKMQKHSEVPIDMVSQSRHYKVEKMRVTIRKPYMRVVVFF